MPETTHTQTPLTMEDIIGTVIKAINASLPISKRMPIGVSISLCFEGLSPTVIAHGSWDDESILNTMAVIRNHMVECERVDIFLDNEPFELP